MDLSERQAKLNTEVRFHNYRNALPLALALRLELELLDRLTPRQQEQLETVQLRIRQLERATESTAQRWGRQLWSKFVQPDTGPALPSLREVTEPPPPSPDADDES